MRNSPLKLFPKEKNRKKRKPLQQGGQGEKPKGNGINPEGWQGKHNNSAKPPFLPCHYAVVFWRCDAVAVSLNFATFLFFFNQFQSKKGCKKHVRAKDRVFLVCFPLSVQNSLNV
ncbi:hypothetical protein BAS06_12100 [Elizabethkingia miricola]|nr:hypothetical protein BAS06_12100 [Elizabethkingia miricola]